MIIDTQFIQYYDIIAAFFITIFFIMILLHYTHYTYYNWYFIVY